MRELWLAFNISKDLQNFLHYVDNKDVKDDQYVDELQDYIGQLSRDKKWRNGYMDNKTHMMFHDEDVREEGKHEAIQQMIDLTRQMGVPEVELKQKVQKQFKLSDQELDELFQKQ